MATRFRHAAIVGKHQAQGMRELLDENQPRTPGVTTSVAVVLAALAVLRGDAATASALLDYAGLAIIQSAIGRAACTETV